MAKRGEVTCAQRAAAFLLGLEKEAAVEVIKHLDENVIVEVVEAMGTLDRNITDPKSIERLHKELIKAMRQPAGARLRCEFVLFRMLEQTLGKEMAGSVFEKIHQRLLQERPFISLESESAFNLARALGGESDAVAALVLAHIDPSLSADVLGLFESERALAIVKRMASLIPPGFETLLDIARQLSERLAVIATQRVDGDSSLRLRTIAEVLNYSEPEVEKSVLMRATRNSVPGARSATRKSPRRVRKNSSRPLCAQRGSSPPLTETCVRPAPGSSSLRT